MGKSTWLVVALVGVLLPLLSACKKTLIFPAPGAVVPGTFMVASMKDGVDISKWTVEFSHQTKGSWVSDKTVAMAQQPVTVVDKFHVAALWPKAEAETDTYRIQVWEGKSLLDEMVLTMSRAK